MDVVEFVQLTREKLLEHADRDASLEWCPIDDTKRLHEAWPRLSPAHVELVLVAHGNRSMEISVGLLVDLLDAEAEVKQRLGLMGMLKLRKRPGVEVVDRVRSVNLDTSDCVQRDLAVDVLAHFAKLQLKDESKS